MADRYEDRYRNEPFRGERGYNREDRGFVDRAGDEVRSWFGDEEAERRRRMDERERERERERFPNRDWNRGGERNWSERGGGEGGWGGGSERWSSDYGRVEYDRPSGSSYGSRSGSESYGSRPGIDYGSSRNWPGSYGGSPYGGSAYGSPYGGSYGSGRWREGNFSGRGPKGYQRPDNRITEDVCDRLAEAPDVDASNIEVKVNGGEVTLTGTVDDRWDKRRAEELIERISGVREVHNNLRVSRHQDTLTNTASNVGTGTSITGSSGGSGNRR